MQQIRFAQLLKHDPLFRKWLARTPPLPEHTPFTPWRLFIQRNADGLWAYKEYSEYTEAYRTLAQYLPKVHDLALSCKRTGFKPPVVRARLADDQVRKVFWPMPTSHEWCCFCRRPVIMMKLRQHRLHPKYRWEDPQWMCGICGARKDFIIHEIGEIRSPLEWPLST